MDRERFDELARLLATKGSRRSAVGTLLGVAILGHDPGEAGAQRGEKDRKDRKARNKNHNRNRDGGAAEAEGEVEQPVEAAEDSPAPEAGTAEVQAETQGGGGRGKSKRKGKGRNRRSGRTQDPNRVEAARCCGTKSCSLPTAGSNRYECNFAGRDLSGRTMTGVNFGKIDGRGTNFDNANLRGANFGQACLQGASFRGANLASTNWGKACLFGADFTGARNLNVSVNFSTSLLCGTILPDETVSDRDCGMATTCCAACDDERPCPDGQVCCNGRCRTGNCCDAGDCEPEQCQTVACTSFQCEYTPVIDGPGALCDNRCCNGVCCTANQVCDANDRCCTRIPQSQTCAGKCGPNVSDGCGGTYDCGACATRICQTGTCNAQNTCDYEDQPNTTTCTTANNQAGICCGGQCVAGGQCCAADDCEPRQCRSAACTGNRCDYAVQPNGPGTLCDDEGEFCCGGSCCTEGQVCDTRPAPDVCCTPASRDTTCGVGTEDPKCGTVIDNCGQEVNCGACAEVTCQTGTCNDDLDTCTYTPVPDNQTGPGCSAPGFCCDGDECCRAGDVCLANGCCTPEPRDTTCAVNSAAPKCGDVTNNCDQTVDCGACAVRTCQAGTCNDETDLCGYTPIFGEPDPASNCTTVCCRNAEGAPVCCDAGITTCTASGLCVCAGDADCAADERCCNGSCISEELCCEGDNAEGCAGTDVCCVVDGRGDCRECCTDEQCTSPAEPVCDANGQCICPAPRVTCNTICCTTGQVCDTTSDPNTCCTPETEQQTCRPAGGPQQCGVSVVGNCGQLVDCGECDVRQCFDATCNGVPDGTCQYEAVFRAAGPGCATVCCQDEQDNPVCCEAGITVCSSAGLCGCAADTDCGTNQICCDGTCIADTQCCGGDPDTCPDPGVCHERACNPTSGACEPRPISGSDPNDECEGTTICCNGACAACCGTDASTCAARECNSVACVGNACAYTASGVAGPCGTNNTGICVRDPDGSGRCVISNNGTTNCIGADACGESPPGGRQCGTVNGYNNGDCACYSTPEGAGICLRRTSSFTYPESAVGCAANAAGLAAQPPCDNSTECPAGAVCVSLVGSGLPICCDRNYPECPGQNNCGKTGFCVAVEPGLCATPRPGTCVPQTPAQACGARDCGTVSDGCSGTVNCGPLNGACPTNETCDANGQCQPIPPPTCEECTTGCCRDGICEPGSARTACGHSGGVCESCNPEVACVNGVCTCTRTSCAQGCCTVVDGKPFCDNTLRPCGDTCIARTACCHGLDASIYQETTPGCRENETCAVNSSGFGECRCGNFRCDRNQGCCELVDGQPTCNTNLRPCGDICIDKTLCCREGVQGCDDGLACTSETCQPATGTGQTTPPGICVQTFPNRTCTEACAAGEGYGNYFPENQREVRCASAGTVYPTQPCFCWRTTENQNVCTESVPGNITPPPCRLSSECPAGQVCIRSGMTTGTNTCAPICQ